MVRLPLLIVLSLLLLASDASAATVVVDGVNGNDAGSGTATAPVKTISRAVIVAGPNDVIEVRDGIYRETVAVNDRDNGVVIRAAEGGRPVIAGEGTRRFGFDLREVTGIVVEGFELRGQVNAGIYLSGTSNVVRDNLVHAVGVPGVSNSSGIHVNRGLGNVVADNVVHSIGPGFESRGIWLVQTKQATVHRNLIYLVRKDGIRDWRSLDDTITSNRVLLSHNGISLNTTTGAYVANNELHDNQVGLAVKHLSYQTVLDYWMLPEAHLSRFWHNSVSSSMETGIWLGSSEEPMDHLDVAGNVVRGGGLAFIRDVPSLRGPNVRVDGNLYVREGDRPAAVYKEGWRTLPAAITDWDAFRARLGWEASGWLVDAGAEGTPGTGRDLGDAYADQLGASGAAEATAAWTPYPMTPVDSSSQGSDFTRTGLGRVSDRNEATSWTTETGTNEFVTLDFGTSRTFNALVVHQFSHDDLRNVHGYRFETSDDRQTWSTVLEGTNPDHSGSSYKYRLAAPATGRFLRYTLMSTSCQSYEPRTGCGSNFILSEIAAGTLTEPHGTTEPTPPSPSPSPTPSSGSDVSPSSPAPTARLVSGSGLTNPSSGLASAFTIDAPTATSGTVTYTGSTKSFSGAISCVGVVGSTATIVSEDVATGFLNRTMVQDNGASGDKLVNTMVNLAKATPKTIAAYRVCVAPDVNKLTVANPLAGNSITIAGVPQA